MVYYGTCVMRYNIVCANDLPRKGFLDGFFQRSTYFEYFSLKFSVFSPLELCTTAPNFPKTEILKEDEYKI